MKARPLFSQVALVLFVAGLVFVLRAPTRDYGKLLERAADHADELERTAAIAVYKELTQRYPRQPRPYVEMARVYIDWGRWAEALEVLSEVNRRDADPAEVEELRAYAYLQAAEREGDEEPAHWVSVVEQGRRALAVHPESHPVRKMVAHAHMELRQWSEARAVYEQLLQTGPPDPEVYQSLGALLLGQEASARRYLRASGTALADQLLATYDDAKETQQLESGSPAAAHTAGARLLMAHGEWALAARHLELAVARDPDDGDGHAYLGHTLDHMGYRDEALAHLQDAIELASDPVAAHTFLGLHYDRWGHIAAARSAYEAAYDQDPQSAALSLEIGQTWAAERRYVAAEIWLREATSLQPNDPAVWEALASFYLDYHISAERRAVEAADRLVALLPDDPDAHDLLGWAAVQIGDDQLAERHLQRALELDPFLASAYYHIGVLRTQQGRAPEAERAFVRAMDLDTRGTLRTLIERAR